jgi:hypothetical protein
VERIGPLFTCVNFDIEHHAAVLFQPVNTVPKGSQKSSLFRIGMGKDFLADIVRSER